VSPEIPVNVLSTSVPTSSDESTFPPNLPVESSDAEVPAEVAARELDNIARTIASLDDHRPTTTQTQLTRISAEVQYIRKLVDILLQQRMRSSSKQEQILTMVEKVSSDVDLLMTSAIPPPPLTWEVKHNEPCEPSSSTDSPALPALTLCNVRNSIGTKYRPKQYRNETNLSYNHRNMGI
jgi:hypothetical protein